MKSYVCCSRPQAVIIRLTGLHTCPYAWHLQLVYQWTDWSTHRVGLIGKCQYQSLIIETVIDWYTTLIDISDWFWNCDWSMHWLIGDINDWLLKLWLIDILIDWRYQWMCLIDNTDSDWLVISVILIIETDAEINNFIDDMLNDPILNEQLFHAHVRRGYTTLIDFSDWFWNCDWSTHWLIGDINVWLLKLWLIDTRIDWRYH